MDERERQGWKVVLGGVLIMLMLGVTYTWSVFAGPLAEKYGWSQTEIQLAFSVMLATFAISMIPAGMLQDRKGPRVVALVGGLLLGLGFIATGLFASSPFMLYLSYGVLAGAGVGFAYVTPLAAGVKWFAEKKGLVSGIIVFGFGFGSLLLAPLASELIKSQGVNQTFLLLGIAFAIVVCAGALLLKNPPAAKAASKSAAQNEIGPRQMLGTRQFWLLWLMFAFSAAAGLMVIGNLATFAKLSFTSVHGMDKDAAYSLAALAVGVLAIFNGAGRILAGWLSDRIGRPNTMLVMFGVQALLLASILFASNLSPWALFAWMCLVGLCFGSNFSLFPSATADFFGTKNMGVNYGFMFTAYGFGGILGPQVMAYILDAAKASKGSLAVGDYSFPFLLLAVLVGISAVISLFTRGQKGK
ncbi:MAG: OFA family MFS transporter [Candidatus Micrarchaeota archaeon]|nr:OFA family MFS transporter [Candidatus Micrarchaeota archaeon]